ncbi:hypothetical protein CSV75_12455 [Sporosarcina sp. P18a]|nr:hypothetical protein CSV75_12455 [Sporosarcina sp. P18a]
MCTPIQIVKQSYGRQMKVTRFRRRTIDDYERHRSHYQKVTAAKYLDDITTITIYDWLESMDGYKLSSGGLVISKLIKTWRKVLQLNV